MTEPRDSRAVRELLAALLADTDRQDFSSSTAARTAFVHLTRPERAGGMLPDEKRETLRHEIDRLAAHLITHPDTHTLTAFAEECVRAARAKRPPPRHPGASLARPDLPKTGEALVRAALYAEKAGAKDDDDLVRRAVTRALREERRAWRGMKNVPLDDGDPLRAVIGLPEDGRVRLKRDDVRQHVAGLAGPVGTLLRDAALFLPKTMRAALGEELFALCRVTGFADARRTRVLVAVPSSAVAQEVSMRKPELLARLRTVPGMERVRDVRFDVVPLDDT